MPVIDYRTPVQRPQTKPLLIVVRSILAAAVIPTSWLYWHAMAELSNGGSNPEAAVRTVQIAAAATLGSLACLAISFTTFKRS